MAENSNSSSSISIKPEPETTTGKETVSTGTGSGKMSKDEKEQQGAEMLEIVRIERDPEEGERENDPLYDKCPQNFKQPSIFELTRQQTLKKMGKLSKEAIIHKVLHKVVFIRENDTPTYTYDPTFEEEMRNPQLPDLPESTEEFEGGKENPNSGACPSDLPHCRLACVCHSINCTDMYEESYEKHCRDTGKPECMHGCICDNPGPHLNGERWIASRPYKYKKQRVRDDEDCGFVPFHMQEQMKEGRPKRKAQAPTRYRPDFGVSEKEMRAYENGNSNSSSGNGFSSKKVTRPPRRRLCELEDEDGNGSDDSDERIITDKKRKSSGSEDESSMPIAPKKGRPTKQQAAKNLLREREPSKRERKPRNLDLPDPEPRRKRPSKNAKKTEVVNGVSKTPTAKVEVPEEVEDFGSVITVTLGTCLHVIDIQPASRTCQGMFAVLRKTTSEIVTFVTWDEGSNPRPYLLDLKFRFTSSRQNQEDLDQGNDVLALPHVNTQDTMWLFYSIKRNYMNWDTILCGELHSVIKSKFLVEVIEKYRPEAMKTKVSRVVDISHINSNRRDTPELKCPPLYLFIGKAGDVYWFGCPPKVYVDEHISTAGASANVLFKRRQHPQRYRNNNNNNNNAVPRKKPKLENSLTTPNAKAGNAAALGFVLNNNNEITNTSAVKEDKAGQENIPMEMEMEIAPAPAPEAQPDEKLPEITTGILSSVPELTTPEVLPPSPAPDPASEPCLNEETYQLLLD